MIKDNLVMKTETGSSIGVGVENLNLKSQKKMTKIESLEARLIKKGKVMQKFQKSERDLQSLKSNGQQILTPNRFIVKLDSVMHYRDSPIKDNKIVKEF